jgi:hypothetical protein
MDGATIGILGTIIGAFVGLAGWLVRRDKKLSSDAEWRGSVTAKLDNIAGIRTDVDCLDRTVQGHGERITAVEESAKSAHKRIDALEGKK